MTKPTSLGHVMSLTVNIDSPVPMNIEKMEYKSIMVMVGANGSGKSMILKLNWLLATIMGVIVMKKVLPPTHAGKIDVEGLTQYTIDHTFDDHNFNGKIGAEYENGSIDIVMEQGKVVSVTPVIAPEVEDAPAAVFMSTNLRTFDQIKTYLKIQKMAGSEEKIVEFYKLYDIAYIKFLQTRMGKGYTATKQFKDTLANFDLDKLELESIEMTDESVYYTNTKGQRLELTTLSKGEQAIINMFLANSIQ